MYELTFRIWYKIIPAQCEDVWPPHQRTGSDASSSSSNILGQNGDSLANLQKYLLFFCVEVSVQYGDLRIVST